jgi:hypothetical protein
MKRTRVIGLSVAGTLALGALISSRLVVFSRRVFRDQGGTAVIVLRRAPVDRIDIGETPRAVELNHSPPPSPAPDVTDEPRITFPRAEEADHNESADGMDLDASDSAMKGDSQNADASTRDPDYDPLHPPDPRGRAAGMGVGAGSDGATRYGTRTGGGRRNLVAGGMASGGQESTPGPSSIEQAHKLATTDEERPRAPALLARLNGSKEEELPLEALRVSTVLMATRARTLVDCTFANPSGRQLEGTFHVRLPEGASPCYLGMFQGSANAVDPLSLLPPVLEDPGVLLSGDMPIASSWGTKEATVEWGTLRPARVVAQERAAQVYEQVVRRRVDPAVMEWAGGNSFSTRIFPILASGRKRVFFAYDQAPTEIGGEPSVKLPVPEKLPRAFRLEVAASSRAYEKATLVMGKGETPLLETGGFFTGVLAPKGDEGAFVLTAAARSKSVRAGFGLAEKIPGQLVHARILPGVEPGAERPTGDAVFLLDTSLSQRRTLAGSCARLLREVLEKDASIERFQVIGFDVAARPITGGWLPNRAAERATVLSAVDNVWLEGATSMECALAAAERAVPEGEHATFFLLSDAQVSWGVDDVRELERAHSRVFSERWIGYQIGDEAVNRPLLDALAAHGGRVVNVLSAQDLGKAAVAHRVSAALLHGLVVAGVSARDVVIAGKPRALFPGQVVEVAFRTSDDPRSARIVLEADGGAQTFSLDAALEKDPLAARAWAETETSSLLALGDKDADQVAVALSQRFALANRAASFLILETGADYKAFALSTDELDLERLAALAYAKNAKRPAGAPDQGTLSGPAAAFLDRIAGVSVPAWPVHARPAARSKLLPRPAWPEVLDPVAVYRDAVSRHDLGQEEDAFRVLSSILEENPRDPKALRLTGFTLMGWERFADAASLFARVRVLRPFEPQAYLGEAFALEALGMAPEAALRYELVLAGHFDARYESYAKQAAKRLYGRLLAKVRGSLEGDAHERALALGLPIELPGHEVHLLWNLEDTDVDLHCIDSSSGDHVYYREPSSKTGGRLLWDNTAGLGPEIYTHPSAGPREIFVDYFGTRSVSGTVPAATLIVYFNGPSDVICRSTVLGERKDKVVLYSRPAER